VAIVHDVVEEMIQTHLTQVHYFHKYASVDTPWVACALSQCTPIMYGSIASVWATHDATQYAGPQEFPYAPVHNSMLIHSDPTDVGHNRHKRGLPP
jgi:hypothetical protein